MPAGISNASTYFGSNEARGKAILIEQGDSTGGAASIIYTVPSGKTFFLISATLSYHATINGDGDECFLYIDLAGNTIIKLMAHTTAIYKVTDSDHAEISFPLPIPFVAGTEIKVMANTADIAAQAYIVGWIE